MQIRPLLVDFSPLSLASRSGGIGDGRKKGRARVRLFLLLNLGSPGPLDPIFRLWLEGLALPYWMHDVSKE